MPVAAKIYNLNGCLEGCISEHLHPIKVIG